MDIATSKILGGIGAILIFIGVFPQISFFGSLPFIGAILVLAALWGLARYYNDQGIFNNALYGSTAGVVGIFAIGAAIFLSAIDFIRQFAPNWNGDLTTLPNIGPGEIRTDLTWESIVPFLATILIAVVLIFIVFVAVAYFFRKSLQRLADKTGVGMFRTTGTLLLIGAISTIILVGVVFLWIAVLLLAISFFSISSQQNPPPQQTSQPQD